MEADLHRGRGHREDPRELPRVKWNWGYFGVKDLFTTINLVGGTVGIHYAMEGNLEYAGYAAFAGFVFGDALDGPVARLTKSGNKFGSEYDRIVDHLSQTVTPAIILYKAYAQLGYVITGIALMTIVLMAASVRHARGMVDEFHFPVGFFGMNRTASGLVAMALPNSTLFFHSHPWGYELGIVVTVMMSIMNLAPIPYLSHRPKGRGMQWYVKLVVWIFLLAPFVLLVTRREFVYDAIFVGTFVYAFGAWIPVTRDERAAFYVEYRRWSKVVATAK
jgi:phosphatidylserine synthase